jgi:3-oxoacyl-[acyl-carrier protein] reductase
MTRALAGEVAIVTGAGINTGAVIARTLARDGAAVVVNYRRAEASARATVVEIAGEGGKAIAVEADISRPADVARLVARAVEAFGTVSILVNNANVRSYRALMDISHEEWRDTLAVTLDGSFYCIQACVPLMRKLGRGTIVNIGGSSAHSGRPRRCHVAAAKAGLAGMTGELRGAGAHRYRPARYAGGREGRRASLPDRPLRNPAGDRQSGAVPVRQRMPLHHRRHAARQRRRLRDDRVRLCRAA